MNGYVELKIKLQNEFKLNYCPQSIITRLKTTLINKIDNTFQNTHNINILEDFHTNMYIINIDMTVNRGKMMYDWNTCLFLVCSDWKMKLFT